MKDSEPIAIIGMSCSLPGSPNVGTFWRNIREGRSYFRDVPADRWQHDFFYSPNPRHTDSTYARKIACVDDLRSFAPERFGIPPRRARAMDPQQRLILNQTRLALDDAGYGGRALPQSTGVYVGASVSEYQDLVVSRLRSRQIFGGEWGEVPPGDADVSKAAIQDIEPIQQYSMVGLLLNMIACNVSAVFDFGGPSLVLDAACSSALLAVHEAVLHLRTGVCDAAIVGGVYAICTPDLLVGFSRIGALSRSDVCRPYDGKADGFVLGEGAGVVILKRLDDALRDNDRVLAVVRGVGLNNDGQGEGPMTPRLSGQVASLARAYRDAGLSPDTVGYIEGHGTATPVGDLTEINALKENARTNGNGRMQCSVASVKGNIGHVLAAAGMAGLIKSVLILNNKIIPPQAGLQTPRKELELEGTGLSIPVAMQPFETRNGAPLRVGVNAFGFGGTNVHVILEEPPETQRRPTVSNQFEAERAQLFLLSAAKPEQLIEYIKALLVALPTVTSSLPDLAYTLTVTRLWEASRLAFIAANRTELNEKLEKALAAIEGQPSEDVVFLPEVKPDAKFASGLDGQDDASSQDQANFDFAAGIARGDSTFLRAIAACGSANRPAGLAAVFGDARTVSLPSVPLNLKPFWVIARKEPVDRSGASTSTAATSTLSRPSRSHQASGELKTLLEQQLAALKSQMDLVQRQAQLLDISISNGNYASHSGLTEAASGSIPSAIPFIAQPQDGNGSAATSAGEMLSSGSNGNAPADVRAPEASIEETILDLIAKVSAFPADSLKVEQKLGADLGFDSLMGVDLFVAITESFPRARNLQQSLVGGTTTIAELIQAVADEINNAVASEADQPASDDMRRYTVVPADRPLALRAAPAVLPFKSPVILIADTLGVATLLAERLRDSGCAVRIVQATESFAPNGETALIDLSGLTVTEDSLTPADLRAPVIAALQRAARLAGGSAKPEAFMMVHSGVERVGLAGFAKALAREWPQALVRSVEIDESTPAALIGERVFDELTGTDQTVEVTYVDNRRQVFDLVERGPLENTTLHEGAVVAISGGGRGLGAKLATELARRFKARLLLLGRSTDEPEVVGSSRDLGGDALYVACDIRDQAQVNAAFEQGRAKFGPIEYVVHAAGVLADEPVNVKDLDRAAEVFDTKVAGALALWEAARPDPLRAFLNYGSWAGRFGSALQTDYSAANHAVARLASVLGRQRPETRVVTIDLPPWEDSGMVNNLPDSVKSAMRSRVRFLTNDDGLAFVVDELGASDASGEVIIGAGLDEEPSVDRLLMNISTADQPWLEDHRPNGHVVVPFAVILDSASAAAQRVGIGSALTLSNFEAMGALTLPDAGARLFAINARGNSKAAEVSIESTENDARPQSLRLLASAAEPLPLLIAPANGKPPELSLADFYQQRTFHGPRLQALNSVLEVGPSHAVALVRASDGNGPKGTTLDVLSFDAMMQLCAYWATITVGQIGLPIGAEEVRLLSRPAPGAELRAIGILKDSVDDILTADLDLLDLDGRPLVQVRGLRCKLMKSPTLKHADGKPAAQARPEANPEVDSANWRVDEFPEVRALHERIAMAHVAGIESPYFSIHEGVTNNTSIIGGQEFINFASYNYLGLSGDSKITEEAIEALRRYGTSVSASRLASGEKPLHQELEREIADFMGCEDAIAMVGGHATNVSVIGHLFGPQDLVIHDSLGHDSIVAGIRLSGAKRLAFPHNDPDALDKLLGQTRSGARRVLIAVEGVYSMDGDIALLDQIIEVKRRHNAMLLVDEAHSLGVLGATGRGIGEHFGVNRDDVELWMGTLSKSLASCGGYIAGSAKLVQYLKYSNPGFVYSVGISPANAAAALAALRELRAHPELVGVLSERSRMFIELCRERGINTGLSDGTPVIPCIVGNSLDCLRLSRALAARRINVQPILYPAVDESLTRLRFFVTARHTEEQIRTTVDALAEELAAIDPKYLTRPSNQRQEAVSALPKV